MGRILGPPRALLRANRMRSPPAVLSLGAVLLGCGGNAARDRALDAAALARSRGDLVGEVLAMREACAADPKNQDVCGRAGAIGEHARIQLRGSAQAACGVVSAASPGSIAGCIDAVEPLRRLFPDDPDRIRLSDLAGAAFAERCGRDAPTDAPAAIARIRCADAGIDAIATPAYSAWAATTRTDAARVLVGLASAPGATERLGARAALLSAAACVSATAASEAQVDPAVRAFREASAPTLHVRSKGLPATELCSATAAAAGGRLACAAAADSRAIVLEASVSIAPIRHTVAERTEVARYLAGTDRYENPEYRIRARDEIRTREDTRAAEADYRRDQQMCDEADAALSTAGYCADCAERIERDRACRRAEDSRAMWETRDADWSRARAAFEATPAMIEHEDWRDTSYVIRDHHWAAPWEAAVRALPGQTSSLSGAAGADDSEHHGSNLAGIAADPLTPPDGTWYLGAIQRDVAASLANLARTELAARATTLRARCPAEDPDWADPAWLDCYASATLLVGDRSLGEALLAAETAAYDRRAGASLPALACR
jgi:hypothetical protein